MNKIIFLSIISTLFISGCSYNNVSGNITQQQDIVTSKNLTVETGVINKIEIIGTNTNSLSEIVQFTNKNNSEDSINYFVNLITSKVELSIIRNIGTSTEKKIILDKDGLTLKVIATNIENAINELNTLKTKTQDDKKKLEGVKMDLKTYFDVINSLTRDGSVKNKTTLQKQLINAHNLNSIK